MPVLLPQPSGAQTTSWPGAMAGQQVQVLFVGSHRCCVLTRACNWQVRGSNRVTDQDPEGKYEALQKYGRDLTVAAREGKLDPVRGHTLHKLTARLLSCISPGTRQNQRQPCRVSAVTQYEQLAYTQSTQDALSVRHACCK